MARAGHCIEQLSIEFRALTAPRPEPDGNDKFLSQPAFALRSIQFPIIRGRSFVFQPGTAILKGFGLFLEARPCMPSFREGRICSSAL